MTFDLGQSGHKVEEVQTWYGCALGNAMAQWYGVTIDLGSVTLDLENY